MHSFVDQRSENYERAHAGYRAESEIFGEDYTPIRHFRSQGTIREDAI